MREGKSPEEAKLELMKELGIIARAESEQRPVQKGMQPDGFAEQLLQEVFASEKDAVLGAYPKEASFADAGGFSFSQNNDLHAAKNLNHGDTGARRPTVDLCVHSPPWFKTGSIFPQKRE